MQTKNNYDNNSIKTLGTSPGQPIIATMSNHHRPPAKHGCHHSHSIQHHNHNKNNITWQPWPLLTNYFYGNQPWARSQGQGTPGNQTMATNHGHGHRPSGHQFQSPKTMSTAWKTMWTIAPRSNGHLKCKNTVKIQHLSNTTMGTMDHSTKVRSQDIRPPEIQTHSQNTNTCW